MKRFLLLLFSTLLLFSFAACGTRGEWDEEALLSDSREVVSLLHEKEYSDVVSRFAPELTEQLSAEELGQTWEGTLSSLGVYQSKQAEEALSTDYYFIAQITERYPEKDLLIEIYYNDRSEIAGLFFTYLDPSGEKLMGP